MRISLSNLAFEQAVKHLEEATNSIQEAISKSETFNISIYDRPSKILKSIARSRTWIEAIQEEVYCCNHNEDDD